MSDSSSNLKKRSLVDLLPFMDANKRRSISLQEYHRKKKQEEGLFSAASSSSFAADDDAASCMINLENNLEEGSSPGYFHERNEEEAVNQSLKATIRELLPKKSPTFDINALARSHATRQMSHARDKTANDVLLDADAAVDMTVGEFSKNLNAILSRNNIQSK